MRCALVTLISSAQHARSMSLLISRDNGLLPARRRSGRVGEGSDEQLLGHGLAGEWRR